MKTRISILLIVVGLLGVSCSDFLDVNDDPNNPTEASPDIVLPVGLDYTATYVQEMGGLNHLGNMMMFTFGESQGFSWYPDEFNYRVNSTFYSNLFNDAYRDPLKQYEELANSESGYYRAIGEIMKAYHFQILVDLYGDVPYSEALQRSANTSPKYDDAEGIYDDLLTKLTDAVATIDSTANEPNAVEVGSDDTIFGGDMDKWKAFANSLKIRMLTRLSDVKGAQFINDHLATISSSDGFITDDVAIDPGYVGDTGGKMNPYWETLGRDSNENETLNYQATCATQFVVDFFRNTSDPRINRIFESPDGTTAGHNGINQGAPNDDPATDAPGAVSNLKYTYDADEDGEVEYEEEGGILKSATMPSTIMTLAEHHFNMAELALEGFNVSGTAEDHYEAGIEASFAYLGVDVDENDDTSDDAEDYYTQANRENVNWSASSNKLDAIMTQKWLATMAITAEQAWFDYNRTGYPSAQPVGYGGNKGVNGFPISEQASTSDRPVRIQYPASEDTRNSGNLPDRPDAFSAPIFWAN